MSSPVPERLVDGPSMWGLMSVWMSRDFGRWTWVPRSDRADRVGSPSLAVSTRTFQQVFGHSLSSKRLFIELFCVLLPWEGAVPSFFHKQMIGLEGTSGSFSEGSREEQLQKRVNH